MATKKPPRKAYQTSRAPVVVTAHRKNKNNRMNAALQEISISSVTSIHGSQLRKETETDGTEHPLCNKLRQRTPLRPRHANEHDFVVRRPALDWVRGHRQLHGDGGAGGNDDEDVDREGARSEVREGM